ncbi:Bro-N domain-containing protein [Polaromonas sp. UC242_47]|uniref:Bro-N domain-containing protein n=1 Tax=Polaromonas sp. UC242_47 TaxID=3374626 RepID=UPI0037A0EA8F
MSQPFNSIRCIFSTDPIRPLRAFSDAAGDFWFIAMDACALMGIPSIPKATAKLDASEKVQVGTDNAYGLHPHTLAVNEAGLYELIAGAQSPVAKAFRKHLTDHITPMLRAIPTQSRKTQ